jgi:predicted dehydrogenase
MAGQIQIGVVGTSWWADAAHLPLFKADSRVEITAICGRNRERAQEMATKYDIHTVYTDYREMIAKGGLQAIVISTPDDEHYAMTMAALDAGLHVLCEKPLALNAGDAKAMYEKAKASGLRHMTFFTYRWMPHYRYMRELIQQNVLGRIYHAQISFLMDAARDSQYRWRFDPQRANGVIGDSGSHMFDLARYLVNDIKRVNARLVSNVRRLGADGQPSDSASDTATIMVEFEGGAHGTIEVSMVTRVDDPFLEQHVVLNGELGTLIGNLWLMDKFEVRLAKGEEKLQTLTIPDHYLQGVDMSQPFDPQFLSMFTHQPIGGRLFVDAILSGQSIEPSFYEGWKAQQVIDAAIASHERGQWIDI